MFRAGRAVAFASCLCAAVNATSAATIYVNNITGDDTSNGRFPERRSLVDGPVKSIARAVQLARTADTISITKTDAPYSEPLLISRPELCGTPNRPLIVEGGGATLRGLRPLDAKYWQYVGAETHRYQPFRKGHYQLYVNGSAASEIRVPSTVHVLPALRPLEWCVFHGWVYFRVEPGRFIDQYQFEVPAHDVGIGLYDARHVIVRNLNVDAFRLDGINVHGSSRGIVLENLQSTSNGRAGVTFASTAQVTARGLVASGNRVTDVLSTGRPIAELHDAKLTGGGRFGLLVEGGSLRAFAPQLSNHWDADQHVLPGAELSIEPAAPLSPPGNTPPAESSPAR